MSSFPKRAIVNIPAGTLLDGQCSVSVRINPKDDFCRLKQVYSTRLFNFEISGESLRNVEFIQALAGMRVRTLLADCNLFETGKVVDALLRLDPIVVVKPDANLIRNINFLTSLNFRVRLDTSTAIQAEDSLLQAADFYLHNPLLTTPIEPFHTLLYTIIRGHGYSMWDIESENVKKDFYVSDNREVSLSRRWNAKGFNYGSLDNPWGKIVKSKLYRRLVAFRLELFHRESACAFCPYLDLCGGFLRAIEADWPCEFWQRVFLVLRDEAQKAKELERKIEQMSNGRPETD